MPTVATEPMFWRSQLPPASRWPIPGLPAPSGAAIAALPVSPNYVQPLSLAYSVGQTIPDAHVPLVIPASNFWWRTTGASDHSATTNTRLASITAKANAAGFCQRSPSQGAGTYYDVPMDPDNPDFFLLFLFDP